MAEKVVGLRRVKAQGDLEIAVGALGFAKDELEIATRRFTASLLAAYEASLTYEDLVVITGRSRVRVAQILREERERQKDTNVVSIKKGKRIAAAKKAAGKR